MILGPLVFVVLDLHISVVYDDVRQGYDVYALSLNCHIRTTKYKQLAPEDQGVHDNESPLRHI